MQVRSHHTSVQQVLWGASLGLTLTLTTITCYRKVLHSILAARLTLCDLPTLPHLPAVATALPTPAE
ncbi:hypothetical protein E2C01_004045 [Portunus trituberculatus]|uniref:Uncharacterized protein n=1 Tax=Portunus trituberculatus TaxID=210409 RepID=A0A5B7CNV1_PORTR|nr:hypothetical protein [Portunus trituberculatus]